MSIYFEISKQKAIMQQVREATTARPAPLLAYIDTYGCQQNESDSEKLCGMLAEMGYGFTSDEYAADVVIINTCAIRENAENRVYGNVGALVHTKKAKPSQIIVFCGCMAAIPEVAEKVRQSYKHVDLMFPPNELWRFPEMLYSTIKAKSHLGFGEDPLVCFMRRKNIIREQEMRPADTLPSHCSLPSEPCPLRSEAPGGGRIVEGIPVLRSGTVKAWLPIMYGCNNFCSYCIVPYVRGRERSRTPEAILEEARTLVADGYKDITLLGQNVNSYGAGLEEKTSFAEIIRQINSIDGEFLIRFMTSHPKDASIELFRAMAESEKAARHIHLPFQAGNDRVLKLMNRGYTHAGYLEKIAAARELMPEIVITSDVIVGFPGETDEEFEDTLRLIEKARFDAMFTFIYSKRPGTPAADMLDTSSREEKQARFDRLLEIQNAISEEKHSQYVGKTVRVLVDEKTADEGYPLRARTNGGRLVHMRGGADLVGRFTDAKITHCRSWSLFGDSE